MGAVPEDPSGVATGSLRASLSTCEGKQVTG